MKLKLKSKVTEKKKSEVRSYSEVKDKIRGKQFLKVVLSADKPPRGKRFLKVVLSADKPPRGSPFNILKKVIEN